MSVVRICTRQALIEPEIARLIMRGANACGLHSGEVIADLAKNIASHGVGVFIGSNPSPRVVAIGHLPAGGFQVAPTVSLAYSEQAPRQLVAEVGAELRKWLLACGFNYALALNQRHTGRSFARGLSHFGFPERLGDLYRFSF